MWTYHHHALTVHQIPALQDNYIYLLEAKESSTLVAVDPAEAMPVRQACEALGKPLTHILNTHHHWDHIGGNMELMNTFSCQVVGAAHDKDRIPGISVPVSPGVFHLDPWNIQVLDVAGHTLGHIAYVLDDALFCGDVLFGAG